jgi:Predicted membrane protein/domain
MAPPEIPSAVPPAVPTVTAPAYTLASEGLRLANYLLDLIAVYVLNFIVGLILGLLSMGRGVSVVEAYIFGFMGLFLYFFIFEGVGQKTIGKLITKTRVVMVDGSKPSWGTIALRTLIRIIPFEPFSALGTVSGQRVWWHDRWVNARVVKD